ncbi:hypothetical protein [Oceanicola sp. S124]|uniref:hypothetical protein n=1 Tax=Oceanicola sp. S124 TaxID=1042378 RepID=UPI000255A96D|nr:hypothetical protein [Oceanicola sp. S124]
MARVTDASDDWQSVTLTQDEVWQVQVGALRVSTAAAPVQKDGIILRAFGGRREDSAIYASGTTVKYKLHETVESAVFVREAAT